MGKHEQFKLLNENFNKWLKEASDLLLEKNYDGKTGFPLNPESGTSNKETSLQSL